MCVVFGAHLLQKNDTRVVLGGRLSTNRVAHSMHPTPQENDTRVVLWFATTSERHVRCFLTGRCQKERHACRSFWSLPSKNDTRVVFLRGRPHKCHDRLGAKICAPDEGLL